MYMSHIYDTGQKLNTQYMCMEHIFKSPCQRQCELLLSLCVRRLKVLYKISLKQNERWATDAQSTEPLVYTRQTFKILHMLLVQISNLPQIISFRTSTGDNMFYMQYICTFIPYYSSCPPLVGPTDSAKKKWPYMRSDLPWVSLSHCIWNLPRIEM
jgi:hypothetical protein